MNTIHPAPLAAVLVSLSLLACGPGERPITIDLEARVGARPFACGGSFDGIGTSSTTLEALDLRFYVHDVRVVTAAGEVPVALADDGTWQDDGVALIDLEDGCDSGSAPTNTRLVGSVPADTGAITGVRFRIGVPPARNHLDSSTAPSPLNLSSMYWGWQAGYKYLRFEGRTTGQPGYLLHVGATGCTGDATLGTRSCASPNLADVVVDGFDPATDVLVADLEALFAASDLDVNAEGTEPGCMSAPGDPDCDPIFEALGIEGTSQSFFRPAPRPAE